MKDSIKTEDSISEHEPHMDNTRIHSKHSPLYADLLKGFKNETNNKDNSNSDACSMTSVSENNNSLQNKQISLSSLTIPSLGMLSTCETKDENEEYSIVNRNNDSRSSIWVVTSESILHLLQSKKNRMVLNKSPECKPSNSISASAYVPHAYKREKNKKNHLKCTCKCSRHRDPKCRLVVLCENQNDSDTFSCDLDDPTVINRLLSGSLVTVTNRELKSDYFAGRAERKSENFRKKSLSVTNIPNNRDYSTKDSKLMFKGRNDLDSIYSDTNLNNQQKLPSDGHTITPGLSTDDKGNTWQINKLTEHDKILRENSNTDNESLEGDAKKRKVEIDYIEGTSGCDDRVRLHYIAESTGESVFVDINPDQEGCGGPSASAPVVHHQPSVRPPEGIYQSPGTVNQPPVRPPGGIYLPSGTVYQPAVRPPGGIYLPSGTVYQPAVRPPGGIYQPPIRPPGGIYLPPPSKGYDDVVCNVCHYPIKTIENMDRHTIFCTCATHGSGPRTGTWKILRPAESYRRTWNPQTSERVTNELQQTESNSPIEDDTASGGKSNTSNEPAESDVNKRRLGIDYIEGSNGLDDRVRLHYLAESTGKSYFMDINPEQGGKPSVRVSGEGNQPSVIRLPVVDYHAAERSPRVEYQPSVRQSGVIYQFQERPLGRIDHTPYRPSEGIYERPVRIYKTGRKPSGAGRPPSVGPSPGNMGWTHSPKDFKRALKPQTSEHPANELHQTESQMDNCKLEPQKYDHPLKRESDKLVDEHKCSENLLRHCKPEARKTALYKHYLPIMLITDKKSLKETKNRPILKLIRSEDVDTVSGKNRDKKNVIMYPVFLSVVDKHDIKCSGGARKE